MQAITNVVLPVFGLILLGFVAGRPPLFKREVAQTLSTFVFHFALPALLFRSMSERGLPASEDLALLGTYYGAILLVGMAGLLAARLLFRETVATGTVLAMGGAFSNLVMAGVPIAEAAFGQAGLASVLLIVTFHAMLLVGSATVLVEVSRSGKGSRPLRTLGRIVLTLVRNPLLLAILGGAAWGALGLSLPQPVDRLLALLGSAGSPCALFSLGAGLVGLSLRGLFGRTLLIVFFKLAALPALVWLLGRHVFDLAPLQLAVAVTCAALPTGANVYIFAQHYQTHVPQVASAVLLTTILSVATSALAITLLAP